MIRKATLNDAKAIQQLINYFAKKDLMLPRSLNEIYENLRDFWVYEEKNRIYGCCALHIVGWEGLSEIKSFVVAKNRQGRGIGSELLSSALDEAKKLSVKKIFVLTYKPNYFKKRGFKLINKTKLPQKIWAECCNCPKFPNCAEVALVKELK
jgi:amino-acid N-acetyltransferase